MPRPSDEIMAASFCCRRLDQRERGVSQTGRKAGPDALAPLARVEPEYVFIVSTKYLGKLEQSTGPKRSWHVCQRWCWSYLGPTMHQYQPLVKMTTSDQ